MTVIKIKYFDEHLFSYNVIKTKEFDLAKLPGDLDIDQQYVSPIQHFLLIC